MAVKLTGNQIRWMRNLKLMNRINESMGEAVPAEKVIEYVKQRHPRLSREIQFHIASPHALPRAKGVTAPFSLEGNTLDEVAKRLVAKAVHAPWKEKVSWLKSRAKPHITLLSQKGGEREVHVALHELKHAAEMVRSRRTNLGHMARTARENVLLPWGWRPAEHRAEQFAMKARDVSPKERSAHRLHMVKFGLPGAIQRTLLGGIAVAGGARYRRYRKRKQV